MPLRRGLRTVAVSLIAIASSSAVSPAPAGAHARSAAAFVDSIGVNTHLTYGGTSYQRFGMVQRRLRELGVRHIRDGLCGGCALKLAQLSALYEDDGIRVDAIAGDPSLSRKVLRGNLEAVAGLGKAVDVVEGANEWDLFAPREHHSRWVRQDRRYQGRLWRMVHRIRGLRHVPVVGPSLVFSWLHPSSWTRLGNLSRHLTYGNSHGYAGGGTPESRVGPELQLARAVSGRKPIFMTEAGWHNAVRQKYGSQPATPPDVAAVYVPRLFLANFRAGIRRTYIYELLDHRRKGEATDMQDAFGLLRASGRPKPAFRSLRNLVHLFREHPPHGHAHPIRVTRVAAPADVRHLTLRGRRGVTYLALWRPRSLWNQRTRTRRHVSSVRTTVTLARTPRTVRVFRPVRSARGARLHADRRLALRVGAAPVVVVSRARN